LIGRLFKLISADSSGTPHSRLAAQAVTGIDRFPPAAAVRRSFWFF